jgi:hypothetical protein
MTFSRALSAAPAEIPLDPLQAAAATADASVAQGKPVEARAGYAAALEQVRATLSSEALAAAQVKLDALEASAAQLELIVVEADAEVQLDGVDVGRTPLPKPLIANPGPHTITLKKPGFITLTQDPVFESGRHVLTLTLVAEAVLGKLHVTVNHPQSVTELLINDQSVGLLPWEGPLPVGKVTLLARNNDESSKPVQVEVQRDLTQSVLLELEPYQGTLEISAAAAGVRISIDGRLMGIQNWRGPLPVGWHRLALAREGFLTQERDVQLKANATETVLINNWAPDTTTPPLLKPDDNHGLYVRFDIAPTFSSSSDGITQHCEESASNARCAHHAPFGAALGLRAGYRFNWIAPEIWGLGDFQVSYVRTQFDHGSTSAESPFYGPPRREDYIFFRYGWAAGVGVRATSPTRGVSATGGIGFGVFSMSGQYGRTSTTNSTVGGAQGSASIPAAQTASSSTAHSYAPGLLFDGGVLIGSSPGTKLFLGMLLAIEFAPQHARTAPIDSKPLGIDDTYKMYGTPGLDVASGTQWRFGPVLGFQFGY